MTEAEEMALSQEVRDLRDRMVRLEADRKWLIILGIVFASVLLGVTNLVAVPAAAERSAQVEVVRRMPPIVENEVSRYIKSTSGRDFVATARKYAAEAEEEESRAEIAAKRTQEIRKTAEVDLSTMLGSQRGCILADPCPQGWMRKATVGIIWYNKASAAPFTVGAGLENNSDWNWVHPMLCCHE